MTERKEKVVAMPQEKEVVKRLQEAELFGISPESDRFLARFAWQVSGHDIVGAGLNVAWESAAHDTLRDQHPMV